MKETILNQGQIKKILPHRAPLLLVDRVTALEPGIRIEAEFYVRPKMEIFRGHFPEEPVLPGVYTVEILILSQERYAGMKPLFIGIDKVKFRRKIQPGDTLEICCGIETEIPEKAIISCSAKVFNKGELACEGIVSLAMRR